MVVKLLAFWTRSEPLTPLRSVRGSAYCYLRRLRLTLSFLDTHSTAHANALAPVRSPSAAANHPTTRPHLKLDATPPTLRADPQKSTPTTTSPPAPAPTLQQQHSHATTGV